MALPRLIHPIQVTFELLRQDEMVMDDEAREPIHGMRNDASGDSFTIPCQVHWNKKDEPQANIGGVVTTSVGYFVARAYDMDQILGAGVRLKRGDRVVSYTSKGPVYEVVQCKLYILHGDPMGHYPERSASLFKYHITDRDPVST